MEGYDATSYGEGIADVYDDWHGDGFETGDALGGLLRLLADGTTPEGDVLELGVGTGRLAIPLAEQLAAGPARRTVIGLDASPAMLDRLRAKPGGERVRAVLGDMAAPLPGVGLALVVVAFNTFFNLPGRDAQRIAMGRVAAALAPGGRFVLEAFVPAPPAGRTSDVELRRMTAQRVVLSVHRSDPATQLAEGTLIELSEDGGVRLRPWSVHWSTPSQLDELATGAGLELVSRHADWDGTPFDDTSAHHVSVYRRRL